MAMGFDPNKNIGQILKTHYERILHPFDMFQKTKLVKIKTEEAAKLEFHVKKEVKQEKRSYEVIELSDDDEDQAGKKLCSEDSKENVQNEIMEMEGNDYRPHGIVSR